MIIALWVLVGINLATTAWLASALVREARNVNVLITLAQSSSNHDLTASLMLKKHGQKIQYLMKTRNGS